VFGSFFNFLTMHVSLPNLWCFDRLFFPWSLWLLNCLQQGWRFLLFHLPKVSPSCYVWVWNAFEGSIVLIVFKDESIHVPYGTLLIVKHGEYNHHIFVPYNGGFFQNGYCHIWDGMNLGDDVTSFYLFHVVLIYPFATLWSFWKWGHNKGDACNIKHQHSIVVKVVAIIEIGIALSQQGHLFWTITLLNDNN